MSKSRIIIVLSVFTMLLVGVVGLASAQADLRSDGRGDAAPATKQIAAPPSEFAALQLPDPATTGVRSRTAMLPVTFDGSANWAGDLLLDAPSAEIIWFAPEGATWHLTLQSPSGRLVELSARDIQLGTESNAFAGRSVSLENVQTGRWQLGITAQGSTDAGYLLVGSKESAYQLYSHLTTHDLVAGNPIGFATYAYAADSAYDGVPQALAGVIDSAELHVTAADGRMRTFPMVDDGRHNDGAAADGVFGAVIVDAKPGEYVAQVVAFGHSAEGAAFVRTSEHVFPVLAQTVRLDGTATTRVLDASRLQIDLGAQANGKVVVAAEVWGSDGTEMIPVAWISNVVSAEGSTLPLTLDARWIALAGAHAPFELRHVRVQDMATHIPVARADTIAFDADALPLAANKAISAVTDDMLMGARPSGPQPNASGGKLLLVHGYCSGGVWPTSNFTEYSVFQDYNQNRSHDTFATLIRDHGAQFPSFGVVAHSQGGAASLHLYTYYWSGLDYSSGSRLIQSVGTPYQGTALAGNLALLGQIFGIGCGTNWDLTYDGAALWLSGIPSWARSRVYYSTTSFTDKWWRYDYCQIASDLLLSDPDDGTTEKWAGQLSGANNMGHKTGWCHTSSMRDPAQYTDYARNVNMNAYANR
ncbi:MAG: conditioned medium factor [Anaerolineae bacterium]|nr:conditioned medium factor [Anaerolineae bacterium]